VRTRPVAPELDRSCPGRGGGDARRRATSVSVGDGTSVAESVGLEAAEAVGEVNERLGVEGQPQPADATTMQWSPAADSGLEVALDRSKGAWRISAT
jgi:hypothetical protein